MESADQRLGRQRNVPLIGGVACAVVVLAFVNRNQWFFFDEWNFVDRLSAGGYGFRDMFVPHNEHWSTLPKLVYTGLYELVGVRSYLPYQAVLIGAHLAVVLCLRLVMIRSGADRRVSDGMTIVLLLLGAGSENLLWAFQMGFVGALALGLAQLLIADHEGHADRRDGLALVLGLLALMTSGAALTMIVVTGAYLTLRRRYLAALLQTVPLGLVYATWYEWLGKDGQGAPDPTRAQLAGTPQFVWKGVVASLDGLTALLGAGAALVIVLVVHLAYSRWVRDRSLLAPTVAGGVLLSFALTAVARISLGTDQATSSRYIYSGAVMLAPLVAVLLSRLMHAGRSARTAAFGLLSWALVSNALLLAGQGSLWRTRSQEVRSDVLATAATPGIERADPAVRPNPEVAPVLTVGAVLRLRDAKKLPIGPVTETHRLTALARAMVRAEPASTLSSSDPLPILGTAGVQVDSDADGCVSLTPTGAGRAEIALHPDRPDAIRLVASAGETLDLVIRSGVISYDTPQVSVALDPGQELLLDFSGEMAIVRLPPGPSLLCGVTVP